MSTNSYLEFLGMLPSTPLQIGTVSGIVGDVATVVLPGGGVLVARGTAAVDDQVFVRDGVIEGKAPAMPPVFVEI
ncbi:hypothetical protein QTI51_04120 [Variovorax sp. J22G73]|uniref:hypothetical protein n=1 Tax=unclassified Variovorax TaxID=663243 RepID=UPI002574BD86|nr:MULTISPECIES: hypothetical protein [unclassified Variovorax]MDM0003885.1 hypothetical protein [Variovorax sp. J22R203]MDM0096449.1 hypothetical protein [Variovorax sp. J22G73]